MRKKCYCPVCEIKVTPSQRRNNGISCCHLCGYVFVLPYENFPKKAGGVKNEG